MEKINKCLDMRDLDKPELRKIATDLTRQRGRQRDFRLWEYSVCVHNAELRQGEMVLDIGSGGSILPVYLAMCGCVVTCCDFKKSKKFRRTIQAIKDFGVNVKVDFCDARDLFYEDRRFDKIFCVSVLEHIPNEEDKKALGEIHRVLANNGIFVGTVDLRQSVYIDKTNESVGQGFYNSDLLLNRLKDSKFKIGQNDYSFNWHTVMDTPPTGKDYTMASFCVTK